MAKNMKFSFNLLLIKLSSRKFVAFILSTGVFVWLQLRYLIKAGAYNDALTASYFLFAAALFGLGAWAKKNNNN